jgi:glyoxylase-like metal-dependent hydrolase (beta-lactamase superfamily II)
MAGIEGPDMTGSEHEVLIVRYGARTTARRDVFLNYHVYGEPDGPMEMDFFFWVIRGDAGPVVVDTGFSPDASRARGRTMLIDPREALADLGIDRGDAPPVIVTHAHYDHIGNLNHFDKSQVVVARAEAEFWASRHARHAQFRHAVEESELQVLADVISEGRALLFENHYQVAPGIQVIRVGGHTPGQSVVVVQTAAGPVVLASDAVHFYEELDRDMPFASITSLIDMYDAFSELKAMLSDGRAAHLVSGHDPTTLDRYPRVPGPGGAKMAVVGRRA